MSEDGVVYVAARPEGDNSVRAGDAERRKKKASRR